MDILIILVMKKGSGQNFKGLFSVFQALLKQFFQLKLYRMLQFGE